MIEERPWRLERKSAVIPIKADAARIKPERPSFWLTIKPPCYDLIGDAPNKGWL